MQRPNAMRTSRKNFKYMIIFFCKLGHSQHARYFATINFYLFLNAVAMRCSVLNVCVCVRCFFSIPLFRSLFFPINLHFSSIHPFGRSFYSLNVSYWVLHIALLRFFGFFMECLNFNFRYEFVLPQFNSGERKYSVARGSLWAIWTNCINQ